MSADLRVVLDAVAARPTGAPTTFVYFLQRPDTRAVKIGFAADVGQRFDQLNGANDVELVLLAVMPGVKRDERALHVRFAAHHKHCEWFHPAPEIIAFIRALPGARVP